MLLPTDWVSKGINFHNPGDMGLLMIKNQTVYNVSSWYNGLTLMSLHPSLIL